MVDTKKGTFPETYFASVVLISTLRVKMNHSLLENGSVCVRVCVCVCVCVCVRERACCVCVLRILNTCLDVLILHQSEAQP